MGDEDLSLVNRKMRRRTFLKGAAVTGATLALTSGGVALAGRRTLGGLEEGTPAVPATSPDQVFNAVCSPNCWMGCRIEAHVRNGRLVKTAMNPFPEPRYNRICLRGLSHAQWVYNPDRIKFPMKRVGARGEGKWQRISWDEAINTIAQRLMEIRDKYGSKAFGFFPGSGNYGAVNGGYGYGLNVFMNLFEATSVGLAVDTAMPLGQTQVGTMSGFVGGNEPLDMSNAGLIIAWGSNMTESQIHNWHFAADAKDGGAKLVVIDPNYSILASKADRWIAPRPGSDPALGLSILNVIITEKLYNAPFMRDHTTLPFLVKSTDGTFARAADGKTQLVWDKATNSAVPFSQSSDPAFEGSYVVDGVSVKPAFQLLADRVGDWSPEAAQAYTQVNPDDVRWLARQYAATRKTFVYPGFGIDRWENAHQNGRTIGTMVALTGNIGEPGAGTGAMGGAAFFLVFYGAYGLFAPTGTFAASLNGWMAYDAIDTGKTKMLVPLDGTNPAKGVTREPVEVPWPLKALWFTQINISNLQESNRFISLLKDENKLEFVVVTDSLPTDTVRYADIVLPGTHWLENDDLVGGLHPYMFRHERAIEPQWEARSDYDIFKALAGKFGWEQHFAGDQKQVAENVVVGLGKLLGASADAVLESYRTTGAARFSPPDFVSNADLKFPTPTGRLEPYSERVVVNYPYSGWIATSTGEDPLPAWEAPGEAWHENVLAQKYPLAYMQEHSRFRVHTTYWDQPWLRELNPEPYVEINPQDARPRGISHGDYVEIFNDRGTTVAKARVTGRIRPGMVNLPKGWQRHQTKNDSGYSDLTKNWTNRLSANGAYFDALVDVRKVTL